MLNFFKILFGLAVIFSTGFCLYRIFIKDHNANPLTKLSLFYFIGCLAIVLELFFLLLVVKRVYPVLIITPPACLILTQILLYRRNIPHILSRALRFLQIHLQKKMDIKECVFLTTLVIFSAFIFWASLINPIHTSDSLIVWGLHGKVIFLEKTLQTDYFKASIFGTPHYPLFIPILEAYFYFMFGHAEDRLVNIIFPLFFLCFVIIFFDFLKGFLSRNAALFFSIVLITMPVVFDPNSGLSSAYADLPLAATYALGVLYLYRWLIDFNSINLVFAALFGAISVWLKNEGLLLYAANIAIAFIIAAGKISRDKTETRPLRSLFLSLCIALALCLPWFIYRLTLPTIGVHWLPQFNITKIMMNLGRVSFIPQCLITEMSRFYTWGMLWLIFIFALLFNYNKGFNASRLILLPFVLVHIFIIIIILFVFPGDVFQVINFGLMRLLAHIYPLLIFYIALWSAENKQLKFLNAV
jgi:hypothetical protein